jgi:hypothetical protein
MNANVSETGLFLTYSWKFAFIRGQKVRRRQKPASARGADRLVIHSRNFYCLS